LIVESAYSFVENRGIKETHSFPELIMRYGLTERVELRLGWNYEIGGAGNEVSGLDAGEDLVFGAPRVERESSISYGVKLGLTRQSRWVPRSAVIVQASTPTSGPDTATQLIATAVAGWELSNRWRFDAGLRYGLASESGDRFNLWAPSAVLRVPVGERLAAHAEYFSFFTTGKQRNTTRHYFSPGLHYLVTPDLEVGFRVGWGLNDQSARFFVNSGFGWRY
jgi:outer membrane receptor protein involved in Fe transport